MVDQQAATNDGPPSTKRRKKERGQNKRRPRATRVSHSEQLCPSLYQGSLSASSNSCQFGEKCRYSHDCETFLENKPPDIGDTCFLFTSLGRCPYGLACRYGNSHMTADKQNVINEALYDPEREKTTRNIVSKSLQERLRKKKVKLPKSEHFLEEFNKESVRGGSGCGQGEISASGELGDEGGEQKKQQSSEERGGANGDGENGKMEGTQGREEGERTAVVDCHSTVNSDSGPTKGDGGNEILGSDCTEKVGEGEAVQLENQASAGGKASDGLLDSESVLLERDSESGKIENWMSVGGKASRDPHCTPLNAVGAVIDEDLIRLRPSEKKQVHVYMYGRS